MKKSILLFSSILMLNVFAQAQTTKWNFDKSHATLGFAVDHMVVSETQGRFADFDVTLLSDKEDFSDAKINVIINVNSVNTENKTRDEHLAGADFFDAAKFPKIEFKGLRLVKTAENTYAATGELTMKGVTKTIIVDVKGGKVIKDPWGKTRTGFKITGTINREDFGLKYNSVLEKGGLALGTEVRINGAIEFVK